MRRIAGKHLLVVEDEPLIAMDLEESLSEVGAEVIAVSTQRAALEQLEQHRFDMVLMDWILADGPSADLAAKCRELQLPFISLSGYPHLIPSGAFCSFDKPYRIEDIIQAIAEWFGLPSSLEGRA